MAKFQFPRGIDLGLRLLVLLSAAASAFLAAPSLRTELGLVRLGRIETPSHPRDLSRQINQGIAAAVRAGLHDYQLPAGNVSLSQPIQVPGGTSDFTIRGQGSSNTTITTTQVLAQAIQIGDPVQLHNNWGLTNHPNMHVLPIQEGQKSIQLLPGERLRPGRLYVLWDGHREGANNDTKTIVMNHAEIVHVTSVQGDTAELDEPVSRDYDPSAQLADLGNRFCRNIKVQGIGFDGATGGPRASSSLLSAYTVEGISVSDVKIRHFETNALYFVNCRHVSVDHADIEDATAFGPGGGYGVALSRCRFAQVTDCYATNCRHGFIAHAGTTDATFERCECGSGGFDAHGMDERRLQFIDCKGAGLQLGNQAWPEGDRHILIRGCSFPHDLNICARTVDLEADDSDLGQINIWSDVTGYTTPEADQAPDTIHLVRCHIVDKNDLILAQAPKDRPVQVGTIQCDQCIFDSTRPEWGSVLALKSIVGNLIFNDCQFSCASQRGDVPILLSSPYPNLTVLFKGCTVRATRANCAAILQPGFAGKASFVGNQFRTTGVARPEFLKNYANAPVQASGNTAG